MSEAFSVVVQQMSESPTYLIEHTTNEQKFRITQRCAIQGHFGILVSHEKFQARDKIEEFLVKVLDGCVEHATDMNDYAMITEAFEDARGLEPLSLLERYPDNKYILDFVASLAL